MDPEEETDDDRDGRFSWTPDDIQVSEQQPDEEIDPSDIPPDVKTVHVMAPE